MIVGFGAVCGVGWWFGWGVLRGADVVWWGRFAGGGVFRTLGLRWFVWGKMVCRIPAGVGCR